MMEKIEDEDYRLLMKSFYDGIKVDLTYSTDLCTAGLALAKLLTLNLE